MSDDQTKNYRLLSSFLNG